MDQLRVKLKILRKRDNITQQQLAFDTGLSVGGIQSIETGRANPSIETLIKFADRFHCSTDYLLGRTNDSEIQNKTHSINIDGIEIFINIKKPS